MEHNGQAHLPFSSSMICVPIHRFESVEQVNSLKKELRYSEYRPKSTLHKRPQTTEISVFSLKTVHRYGSTPINWDPIAIMTRNITLMMMIGIHCTTVFTYWNVAHGARTSSILIIYDVGAPFLTSLFTKLIATHHQQWCMAIYFAHFSVLIFSLLWLASFQIHFTIFIAT